MSEVINEIIVLKAKLGGEVLILAHHYQRLGIVDLADHIGDSFGLAKIASQNTRAKKIVFCGVRFMAESAAILCRDDQKVYHPEPEAGCPMADMAPMDSVQTAWNILHSRSDIGFKKIIPVTYMNSHAPLKAFTGLHGGAVCTSSNARKVMEWAWGRGEILLFFPDQHLGRNTAKLMGLQESEMKVWYPSKTDGGVDTLEGVKLILWNGHCPVHMKFTARDVRFVRKNFPLAKVVVHPECEREVVDLADANGSTEFIAKYVRDLPAKTQIFIATEQHLIERLRKENPHIRIEFLSRSLCPTMYMVDLEKLHRTLAHLETEDVVPMPEEIKNPARLALERMLALA